MKKLFIFTILFLPTYFIAARWTVLIYMEPNNNLLEAAWRNINDLARADTNGNATLCVQLHAYDEIAWRYRIEHGTIKQVGFVNLNESEAVNIAQAAHWAYDANPADHYGLVLWGNGHGILDPEWDENKQEWATEDDDALYACQACAFKRSGLHRGNLFHNARHTYLASGEMVTVLRYIQEEIVHKKLDVLGFDVCLAALLEHAYQVAPYAEYFVACQNCELPDGFEYHGFVARMAQQETKPLALVQGMVEDYNAYYEQRAYKGEYTLSALDCAVILQLKNAVDVFAEDLIDVLQEDSQIREQIKELLHEECPHFCFVPMYTDLYTFAHAVSLRFGSEYVHLGNSAAQVIALIEQAVVANATGHSMTRAHGISIYFPYSHIDSSYLGTQFAQESAWREFLKEIIAA